MRTFDELIAESESHPTRGWDFSWLGGRVQMTQLPWDFEELVVERARASPDLLDLGTGGGEWLSSLPHRPRSTVATESWPPNVPVAEGRLSPLGVEVVRVDSAPENVSQERDEARAALPFPDASFHLVVNRHETFVAAEVFRILAAGGRFLTQQLGDGRYTDFRAAFDVQPPEQPAWVLALASAQLERAGFGLVASAQGEQVVTFEDVGALAWYLRMIPWTVPGFSTSTHRRKLLELHRALTDRPLSFRLPAFYVEAAKRSAA